MLEVFGWILSGTYVAILVLYISQSWPQAIYVLRFDPYRYDFMKALEDRSKGLTVTREAAWYEIYITPVAPFLIMWELAKVLKAILNNRL